MISRLRAERIFYGSFAAAIAVVVFVGFAPTFYLRRLNADPRPLTTLLYFHGTVFTAWIILLITQSSLISARRADLHRRLGLIGIALAIVMVALAAATAMTLAGRLEHNVGAAAAASAALSLFDLPVFALLIAAAFLLRRDPQTHKRLIVLATVVIIGAAANRLPLPAAADHRFIRFAIVDLFAMGLVTWDIVSRRAIHPATIIGSIALLTDQVAQATLRDSPAWARIVASLVA